MPAIATEFSLTLDVVTANSSRNYAECFTQIGTFLKGKRSVVISHIKANHSADGYTVSVFFLRDIKEQQ